MSKQKRIVKSAGAAAPATFTGAGIGAVLGFLLMGPPGAAIGGGIGGFIGGSIDSDDNDRRG